MQLFDVVFVCFTTIENMVLQILSLVSSFVVVLVYCTVVLLLLAEYALVLLKYIFGGVSDETMLRMWCGV